MEITYHGLSCIRLRGRQAQILVDPPAKGGPKTAPDILVRTDQPTDPAKLRPREGHPQEVSGSGEFEVKGIAIAGMPAEDTTIMRIEVDDVRVVTVGALKRQLTGDEIDSLGHVDVLVLPVGGGDALDAAAATKLTRAIEPAIVVPVRYQSESTNGKYESVDNFAKEMGLTGGVAAQPKLNLTGSMPNSEETRVVVLEARTA